MEIYVVESGGVKTVKYFGQDTIPRNTMVHILTGPVYSRPTKYSIQIGENQYIEDEIGRHIQHSDNPNLKIVGKKLVAIKNIRYGKTLTCNHNRN